MARKLRDTVTPRYSLPLARRKIVQGRPGRLRARRESKGAGRGLAIHGLTPADCTPADGTDFLVPTTASWDGRPKLTLFPAHVKYF